MTTDTELRRARWLAATVGFLCATSLPVLLFFSDVTAKFLDATLHHYVGGRPMPALTEWLLDFAERLPGSLSAWLIIFAGVVLLVYVPLLVAIRRALSVATVALIVALWLGLLFTVELLIVCLAAFILVLPFAPSTGKLKVSASVSTPKPGSVYGSSLLSQSMNNAEDAAVLYERSRRHGDRWRPPQDAEHAALLMQAAELGSIDAQRDLGCCYATGENTIPQSLVLARLWYGRAADAGHADAQYNFGCMLLDGEGGPKEPETGMAWVRRAAAQDDPCAVHFLAQWPAST